MALKLRAWSMQEAALERFCSRVKAQHLWVWVGLFFLVVIVSILYSGGRGEPFDHSPELEDSYILSFHPSMNASIQQNLLISCSVSGTIPGSRDSEQSGEKSLSLESRHSTVGDNEQDKNVKYM